MHVQKIENNKLESYENNLLRDTDDCCFQKIYKSISSINHITVVKIMLLN